MMIRANSISNYHVYNLLQMLEKTECMGEGENEVVISQNTLLAQIVSLTNLISTVAGRKMEAQGI